MFLASPCPMPALTFVILTAFAALSSVTAQCNPGQFTAAGGVCTDCAPGTFSTDGSAAQCSQCPQGTFNNVPAAVGCCSCCSGFYQDNTGQTTCNQCPGGQNSPVGATSAGDCGSNTAVYPAVGSCAQTGNSRTCPATFAGSPTNNVRRRRSVSWSEEAACPKGHRRCNGKCTDISSNLWHCGACAGTQSSSGVLGQDCSEIPFVSDVRCERKRCIVESCSNGRSPSLQKRSCVWPRSGRRMGQLVR